jgi:internalin A
LSRLPDELFELGWLEELKVGSLTGWMEGGMPNRIEGQLANIVRLRRLSALNCSGTDLADLEPLAGLPALTRLWCHDTQISELAPLAVLPGLTSLDCSFTQVADLAPLAGLSALTSLDCGRTPRSRTSRRWPGSRR